MEGEEEQEKDWRRKKGGGEDKFIFVLCLRCGRWFSFNVSGEERRFSPMRLSRGDCHQFASWHLNHPLQIWVFEMQIQLNMPREIKRHTQEWRYNFLLVFIIGVCIVKHSLLFFSFQTERTQADNVAHSKNGILSDYIFICRYVLSAERRRKDGEVLFLSCPWLHCLCLAGCVRLGASLFSYFFFFFHKTQRENMMHIFPPLSISLTLQLFKHQ